MNLQNSDQPTEQFTTARIRATCRENFESAIPRIGQVARGEVEDASSVSSIRALDVLGKYGIGPTPEVLIEKTDWMEAILQVTTKHITDRAAFDAWWAEVLQQLNDIS